MSFGFYFSDSKMTEGVVWWAKIENLPTEEDYKKNASILFDEMKVNQDLFIKWLRSL